MRAIISSSAGMDGSSSGGSKGRDGGSAADGGKSAGARGTGGLGVGCGGDVGCEKHPSSCGIRCFLAKTAAWLLAWVASLTVFALFCGRGAGCGDSAGNGGVGCGDWESGSGGGAGCDDVDRAVGDGRVLAGGTACTVVAGLAVAEFSLSVDGGVEAGL